MFLVLNGLMWLGYHIVQCNPWGLIIQGHMVQKPYSRHHQALNPASNETPYSSWKMAQPMSAQVVRKLFLMLSWKLLPCRFYLQILVLFSSLFLPWGVMRKARIASRDQTGPVGLLRPPPYRTHLSPQRAFAQLRGVRFSEKASFPPLSPWSEQGGG